MKDSLDHACNLEILGEVAKNCGKKQPKKVIKTTHISKHHQDVIDDATLYLDPGRECQRYCEVGYY